MFIIVLFNSYRHVFITQEASQIYYWLNIKKNYAISTNNPKIIFLSGSNGMFGIRTDIIEKEIKRKVVNYCTHAGLGNYIFENVKEILQENDIIILPLEYNYYSSKKLGQKPIKASTEYEYIIGFDYKQFLKLSFIEKLRTVSYFMFNLYKFKKSDLSKIEENSYSKLNKNGDNISYRLLNDVYSNKNSYLSEIKDEYNEEDTNGELKLFLQWCYLRHIKVYAIAPNINHQKETSLNEQKFFQHIQNFYKQNNVEFLGNFEDGFFKTDEMFDTSYHLNTKGQNKRTQYLIKLIKQKCL
jgi:hypothetical protein